jgi:hypothetical protein
MRLDEVASYKDMLLRKIISVFEKNKFTPREDETIDVVNKYGADADVDVTGAGLLGMLHNFSERVLKQMYEELPTPVMEAVETVGDYKLHQNNVDWSWDIYKGDEKVKSFMFDSKSPETDPMHVKRDALAWIKKQG